MNPYPTQKKVSTAPRRATGWARVPLVCVLVASLLGAGVLFLGTPAPTASAGLPDSNTMTLVADGHDSSASSVAFWSRRVAEDPDSVPALVQLASAQLAHAGDTADLGGYGIAEATAQKALSITPDRADALLVLARSRAGQHDFHGALALADRVLENDPGSIGALLSAGDAHLELGDYLSARSYYDRASVQAGGAASVLSRYARLEAVTGSIARAETLAREALIEAGEIDLRHADAAFYWFQLATFEFARGDSESAHRHLGDALSIDPTHPGSRELLAQVLVALGDEAAAIELYEEMTAAGAGADIHGALAALYERAGRPADARLHVELGLAIAAETANQFAAERRHIISFLADHDPLEALRLAELDLNERQDVDAHGWYAWALLQTGRIDEAVEAIVPALAHGTESARLRYQAGMIHAAAGNVETARELLTSALDLNPHFDIVHADRARAALQSLSSD